MPHNFSVDTHAIIWYFEGNSRLGAAARIALDDRSNTFIVSMIALAEALRVVGAGRTAIPSRETLFQALDADPRLQLESLDRELIELAASLTAVTEMHDQMIVASVMRRTNAGEAISLTTHDAQITRSNLVPIVW